MGYGYPPDDEHYDPYSGKFKNRPSGMYGIMPRRQWSECGVCLVLVLMLLAVILGAVIALTVLPEDWQPTPTPQVESRLMTASSNDSPTPFIPTLTPPNTALPRPSATPTASPTLLEATSTPRRLIELPGAMVSLTPTPFILPPTPTAIRQAGSDEDRFAFFAQNSNLPRSLNLIEADCDSRHSRFTLVFDHRAESNLPYFEVTLTASGDDAFLTDFTPQVTQAMVISQYLTLSLNENTTLNLINIQSGDIFLSIFNKAWETERLTGVKSLSLTWTNTAQQPNMSFYVEGSHPHTGGLMLSVRWTRDPNTRLEEGERLTFQAC